MQTVTVSELQKNLGSYIDKVKHGAEIVIEEENLVIARILPFERENSPDENEKRLVAEGLMRLPKKKLPADFWDLEAPEISLEKIVKTIREERDDD